MLELCWAGGVRSNSVSVRMKGGARLKRPRWLSWGYFDSLGKIVAGLTAIVALIGGIVSLVLVLSPDPLQSRKATLTDLHLVAQESLEDFLQETGQPRDGYTQEKLRQFGNYYIVRASVEGLRNRNPEIVWSVHSRSQKAQLQPELWIHQVQPPPLDVPANSYEFTAQVWIQRPPVRGRFYVLIQIDYPHYAPLAITFSKDFSVTAAETVAEPTTTTVTRTYVTVRTARNHAITTATTVEQTTSTGTTLIPTTTTTTVPGTTTTVLTTTTKTVTSPAPIVRPPAVTVRSP